MVLVMFGVAGCSNKVIYDNLRLEQRNKCVKEPLPAYFECIERTNKSYEEYEREHKEISAPQEQMTERKRRRF